MNEQAHPDYNADMERQATRSAEALVAQLEQVVNQQRYELDVMALRLEAARGAYDRLREALEAEHNRALVAEAALAALRTDGKD